MASFLGFIVSTILFMQLYSVEGRTQGVIVVLPGAQVYEKTTHSSKNIVHNYHSCGGPSQIRQWRYSTCTPEDPICHVPTDNKMLAVSHVDFIPSEDIKTIGLRVVVKSKDGLINSTENLGPIPNTFADSLKPGVEYTVMVPGGVTEALKGKAAVFQYILYDTTDGRVEACAETDLQYD